MSFPARSLGRLVDALDRDGVIVVPCPVGYVAATSSASGVDRIFELKGRDRSRSLSVGGCPLHEGRRYLQELAGLGGLELSALGATMGLIGTRRPGAPATPEGVGTEASLALFVGLGPILEALAAVQRAAGRALYLTSANASGTGNAVLASQLPPALRGDGNDTRCVGGRIQLNEGGVEEHHQNSHPIGPIAEKARDEPHPAGEHHIDRNHPAAVIFLREFVPTDAGENGHQGAQGRDDGRRRPQGLSRLLRQDKYEKGNEPGAEGEEFPIVDTVADGEAEGGPVSKDRPEIEHGDVFLGFLWRHRL